MKQIDKSDLIIGHTYTPKYHLNTRFRFIEKTEDGIYYFEQLSGLKCYANLSNGLYPLSNVSWVTFDFKFGR